MRKQCLISASCGFLLVGCAEDGSADDAALLPGDVDAQAGLLDAAVADAASDATEPEDGSAFADTFADRVRTIAAGFGSGSLCAFPLDPEPAADATTRLLSTRATVAAAVGLPGRDVTPEVVALCSASAPRCASSFEFHTLALGEAWFANDLTPLARELEQQAAQGEAIAWNRESDGSLFASCISGSVEGTLVGVCVVSAPVNCPHRSP